MTESETPSAPMPGADSPSPVAGAGMPRRHVEVVFEVSEDAELANVLAHEPQPTRPVRPLFGAVGALLGAGMASGLWLGLMRVLRAEVLPGALLVAVCAGIGATLFGGRSRANQVAAALAALAATLLVRTLYVVMVAQAEIARAIELVGPESPFVRQIALRQAERFTPLALAERLGDGLGLATYLVVVAIAWRIPRRT